MSIVIKIKTIAKEQGHTLASLERELGLGNGTIRRWDDTLPSADKLLKVSNFLNTSTDYLLGIEKEKVPAGSSDKTLEFMKLYSQLSEEQQKLVLSQIKGILADE